MTEQPSLEAGLRKIRRARIRAWAIYLIALVVILCACPVSLSLDTQWRFALFPILPAILLLIGYIQVDGLLCPRCGHWFFGSWFEHRGIYLWSACRQCGLRL